MKIMMDGWNLIYSLGPLDPRCITVFIDLTLLYYKTRGNNLRNMKIIFLDITVNSSWITIYPIVDLEAFRFDQIRAPHFGSVERQNKMRYHIVD